jgi:hypothetical protein
MLKPRKARHVCTTGVLIKSSVAAIGGDARYHLQDFQWQTSSTAPEVADYTQESAVILEFSHFQEFLSFLLILRESFETGCLGVVIGALGLVQGIFDFIVTVRLS